MVMKKPKFKQRARKRTSMLLSSIGTGAGMLSEQLPSLQGVLPNKWYLFLFVGIFLANWIMEEVSDA